MLVQTDSLYHVPDSNRANKTLAATNALAISVPSLTLGTPTTGASFSAAGQDQYYQVTVPAGGSLTVALASAATGGVTALYVIQGVLPTPFDYQFSSDFANQAGQTITVPQVLTAGT